VWLVDAEQQQSLDRSSARDRGDREVIR
jgi:hypothetical protein